MIEFIKQNWLACVIVLLTVAVALYIVTKVIVRMIKKRSLEKLEKMITENPATFEDEIAVTGSTEQCKREGDADLKWVKEQSNMEKESSPIKKPSKDSAPKTTKKAEKATAKKVSGKWVIREKGDGEFTSYLHASNGEILLTSEIYSSATSAKRGITTIKKNIELNNFEIYCDKNRNFYFKLKSAGNKFLCAGETYSTKNTCNLAIESVKRFADSPISPEIEQDITIIQYQIPAEKEVEINTVYTGKWVIVDVEDMFIAQLFASNGELLLSSESYSTVSSAKSAIETITQNGLAGNFIIDKDKKGRYFFKLRNAQKSTLCVGETYAERTRCESAIESVRRFLKTAKLAE